MNLIQKLFDIRKYPKSQILDKRYRVVEAFRWKGVSYFMFDNAFEIPTGRAMAALTIYEEVKMRCTHDYLKLHVQAVEKILSDPKRINVNTIALLHNNLKERMELAPFPEHIYKLASVVFFDGNESPYNYDQLYNNKKIQKWKASGGMLDFFLKTQLKELLPFSMLSGMNASTYFQVSEMIDELHQQTIHEVLSKTP